MASIQRTQADGTIKSSLGEVSTLSPNQSKHGSNSVAVVSPVDGSSDLSDHRTASAIINNNKKNYPRDKEQLSDEAAAAAVLTPMISPDTIDRPSSIATSFIQSPHSSSCNDIYSLPVVITPSSNTDLSNNSDLNNNNDSATINNTLIENVNITTPLKSPFVTSMMTLDSKLYSLKKKDEALGSKIDDVMAWMDRDISTDDYYDDYDDDDYGFDGMLFKDWDESRDLLGGNVKDSESLIGGGTSCFDGMDDCVVASNASCPTEEIKKEKQLVPTNSDASFSMDKRHETQSSCRGDTLSFGPSEVVVESLLQQDCFNNDDEFLDQNQQHRRRITTSSNQVSNIDEIFQVDLLPSNDACWLMTDDKVNDSSAAVDNASGDKLKEYSNTSGTTVTSRDCTAFDESSMKNTTLVNSHQHVQRIHHESVNDDLRKKLPDLTKCPAGFTNNVHATIGNHDDYDAHESCTSSPLKEKAAAGNDLNDELEEYSHTSNTLESTTCVPTTNSIRNIGKVSYCALSTAKNKLSLGSNSVTDSGVVVEDQNNRTLFFSPVDANSESQIYLTPFSSSTRNASLRVRRDGNLFNTASNNSYAVESSEEGVIMMDRCLKAGNLLELEEVNDGVESERHKRNLQTTSNEACNSVLAPSLCSTEASKSQLWTCQNPFKSQTGKCVATSGQHGNEESRSLSQYRNASLPQNVDETPKQCSSPILPKQLYNAEENAESTEDNQCDDNDNSVSLSDQQVLVPEAHYQLTKEGLHRANAHDELDTSSSCNKHVPIALAHSTVEGITTTASLTHQYYSELDRMNRDDLLALAVKLQCQLFDRNSIAAADMSERDVTKVVCNSSMEEGRSIPASKSEGETSVGNINRHVVPRNEEPRNECHNNEATNETTSQSSCAATSQLEQLEHAIDPEMSSTRNVASTNHHVVPRNEEPRNECHDNEATNETTSQSSCTATSQLEQLEHTIYPEMSSTRNVANASMNSPKNVSVCNSCVKMKHYEERITALILENEELKAQLELFDRNGLTPNKNNCTNIISSPQTSPHIECARPVDLETLFRATPRKDEKDSSSLSRYSSTNNCESFCGSSTQVSVSVLEERLNEAIESREHLEELHLHFMQKHSDLESDLIEITKDRESVVYELDQVSSLVSLLENSQESLTSGKLITEKERDQLNSNDECLTKQLSEVRSEVKSKELNHNAQLLHDRIDSLEADKCEILEKLKLAKRQLMDATSEINMITEEREKQDQRIKELLSDLTAIDEEKAQLEESFAKLSCRVDSIRQQINQKEATIDSLRRYFGRLEDAEKQLRSVMAFDDDETTVDFQILDHNQFDERSCFSSEYTTYHDADTTTHESSKHIAVQNDVGTSEDVIAKSHEKQSDQSHFRSISANLSVIVLQHKFRSRKASQQFSINEHPLLYAKEKLAASESSLEKLNTDYWRLEQDNFTLRKENDALSSKLNGFSMSRSSSEALVLDNDCEVEAVNCTRYSPVRLKEAEPDSPPCNENILHDTQVEHGSPLCNKNLHSRINGLALALIKLKIRERSLTKANEELKDREILFQDKMVKTEEVITQLLSDKHHLQVQIAESNEKIVILEKQVRESIDTISELQAQNSAVKECDQSVEISLDSLKQSTVLEEQIISLQSALADAEKNHSHTITELKASHEHEKHKLIGSIESNDNHTVDELNYSLLQEKQAASSLRNQLEVVISQKANLETSMKEIVDEDQRLRMSIASLKTENDNIKSKLLECQDTITISSHRIRGLESELNSQEDSNTTAIHRTVEELNRKIDSVTSERDHIMQQFVAVSSEVNTMRIENEKLKHRLLHGGNHSDMMNCSVKSFDSCEHVGTICEEERRSSPGTEIFEILSSPNLTEEDILKVSNKMRQVHSTLNKVQQERSSLRQEVKLLQESLEKAEQKNDLVSRDKVEMLLRKHSESQNEIARLRTELASYEQQKIINFTNPFTSVSYDDANCPQFEVSLETPRASNQMPTHNLRPSPRNRKLISPRSSKKYNSKERIEVKKGHSIFNMFSKSNRTGRKDYIKYRDPHKDSSQSSMNSSEPISPGEKRKREQAELMIKSLRRKYGA